MYDVGTEMQSSETQSSSLHQEARTGCMDEEVRECNQEIEAARIECDSLSRVTASELMSLLESQRFMCALSGVAITPRTAALDHNVSVADGGTHAISNLQWLVGDVNRMKGRMSSAAFIEVCRRVVAHADRQRDTP